MTLEEAATMVEQLCSHRPLCANFCVVCATHRRIAEMFRTARRLADLAPPAASETESDWYIEARVDSGNYRGTAIRFIREWRDADGKRCMTNRQADLVFAERDAEIERLKERISHDHEKCGWCGLAHGPGWYNGVNEEPDGWAECFYRNEVDRITHELSALQEGVKTLCDQRTAHGGSYAVVTRDSFDRLAALVEGE